MNDDVSTIAALATAPAPAGIAVVRVSGPLSRKSIHSIFRAKKDPVQDPRRLVFGELLDYKTGAVIDAALAVFMPGPHSFTGEDVCEFQFHGSPLMVQRVLRSLYAFGIHPAEPGEFTKRGFLNGKMDLVQAEAISDLITATSEQALKIAAEQLDGKLSAAVGEIGEPLRDILAELEATVDFPEEEIEPEKLGTMQHTVRELQARVSGFIESYDYGHLVKDGFRVLLCGRPNAGKSSLLNLIIGSDRAIVTDVSGTTRDLIEAEATFSGYRFIFCDSAGLTDSQDTVEKIGIELARERIPWADLVLVVADATKDPKEYEQVLSEVRHKAKKIWMITNKIDANPAALGAFFCDSETCAQSFYLSAKTRHGLENVIEALVDEVSKRISHQSETSLVVTNERQRNCFARAADALREVDTGISEQRPPEIVATDVRAALAALEEVIGKTYTEDILGRIFSKFCIGK